MDIQTTNSQLNASPTSLLVVEYLNEISAKYSDTLILDTLATKYFRTEEPSHNIYLKQFLISAVARARCPGCKVDTALILIGEKGLGMSSFCRQLFGARWFYDDATDTNNPQELMQMHQQWGVEIPNIDWFLKKPMPYRAKLFLSRCSDTFRLPYAREASSHRRPFVLAGTSNDTNILHNLTDSRRLWIIPVNKEIPLNQLSQERDQIWAAANELYEQGYPWCSNSTTNQHN